MAALAEEPVEETHAMELEDSEDEGLNEAVRLKGEPVFTVTFTRAAAAGAT